MLKDNIIARFERRRYVKMFALNHSLKLLFFRRFVYGSPTTQLTFVHGILSKEKQMPVER